MSREPVMVPCPACEGSGEYECDECDYARVSPDPGCEACAGSGVTACGLCIGEGVVTADCARGYRDGLEAGTVKG